MAALLVSQVWWHCQGLSWDCIQAQVQDWAVSQGAAVLLDREADVGSLGAGDLSRAALPTALPQAEGSFQGLGLAVSGAGSGCLEALCRPLLGSGCLC